VADRWGRSASGSERAREWLAGGVGVTVRAGASAEWAGRWAEGERVVAWEGAAAAGWSQPS
jgi:hypothetical protein